MPAAVEVMASTPNSQGVMDSSNASDKKRNKLGYHRTSVACGQYLISSAFPTPPPFSFVSLVALSKNAPIITRNAGLSDLQAILVAVWLIQRVQSIVDDGKSDAWWRPTTPREDVRIVSGCERTVNSFRSTSNLRSKRSLGPTRGWSRNPRTARSPRRFLLHRPTSVLSPSKPIIHIRKSR